MHLTEGQDALQDVCQNVAEQTFGCLRKIGILVNARPCARCKCKVVYNSKLWFVNDPQRRHANALNLANELRVKYDRPTQQDVRHYLVAYLLLVRESLG